MQVESRLGEDVAGEGPGGVDAQRRVVGDGAGGALAVAVVHFGFRGDGQVVVFGAQEGDVGVGGDEAAMGELWVGGGNVSLSG